MPKYKVLKSVAHNLGHSFLSDMNTMDSFKSFVGQHLLEIAADRGEPLVEIDFISGTITPLAFAHRDVQRSLSAYRKMLESLVQSQGAAWSMISEARLRLRFDLDALYLPDGRRRRRPVFDCRVEIVDDRGRRHEGHPKNWWNDPMGGLSEA